MISLLLSLIPGSWLIFLKKLPWSLIGYAAAAVAVVWAVATVYGWMLDSIKLQATEKALATRTAELAIAQDSLAVSALAYAEAAGKAESIAAADKATRERVERELKDRIATTESHRRDLARRLLDAARAACPGAQSVPGAAPVAGAVSDGGEPGGTGEIGRLAEAIRSATADAFAACARDGEALSQVGPWYEEIKENRGENR